MRRRGGSQTQGGKRVPSGQDRLRRQDGADPGQPADAGGCGAGHVGHQAVDAGQREDGGGHTRQKVVERLDRKVPAIEVGECQFTARQRAQNNGRAIVWQRRHVALKLLAVVEPLLDNGNIVVNHRRQSEILGVIVVHMWSIGSVWQGREVTLNSHFRGGTESRCYVYEAPALSGASAAAR